MDVALLDDLAPDLILTQGLCDVCAVTPETIEASLRGVARASSCHQDLVLLGESLEGICRDFFALAEAVNRTNEFAEVWADRKQRWDTRTDESEKLRCSRSGSIHPTHRATGFPNRSKLLVLSQPSGLRATTAAPKCRGDPGQSPTPSASSVALGLEDNIRFAKDLAQRFSKDLQFDGELVAFDEPLLLPPHLRGMDGAEVTHRTFIEGEVVEGLSAFVRPLLGRSVRESTVESSHAR